MNTSRVNGVLPNEIEEYQLDRQATALKKAGDWDGAIAALRQRKAMVGVQWQDDKLAKYLQAAGRFDEAMAEIQWLLDNSHAWAQALFSHQPTSVLLLQRTIKKGQIHDSAALICKRAKAQQLQADHERTSEACWRLVEKIKPVADADKAALANGWEEARKEGREPMAAHLAARKERIERNRRP